VLDDFVPAVAAEDGERQQALAFAFRGDQLLVHRSAEGAVTVPTIATLGELHLTCRCEHFMGRSRVSGPCVAVDLDPAAEAPPGMAFSRLRQLYGSLDDAMVWIGGRAVQIVAWWQDHQYCGGCGGQTEVHAHERARVCTSCQRMYFPRLSPAIIVLIHQGEQFLLARNRRFPKGRYSIIAGFVEPGESLEEAVRREVREEVDLAVAEIRYFGSQPWPFPNSLMLGFTARYSSGEIRLADGELQDAGWYPRDRSALPDLPDAMSISRRLIEHYLDGGCGE
jgi:NAD+ diphosphatase